MQTRLTTLARAALGLAIALLILPSAKASILVPLSTADLVARAERILVGTVESRTSHWLDEGRSAIVTDVRIRVTQGMRGVKDGEVITVRRLGGSVDGIGMKVFGEAAYEVGEEVLLFSERRGDAFFSVGMSQGKMHVATEGGRKVVQVDLHGAELLQRSGAQKSAGPAQRPLAEVLREVTSLMQRIPAKPAVNR